MNYCYLFVLRCGEMFFSLLPIVASFSPALQELITVRTLKSTKAVTQFLLIPETNALFLSLRANRRDTSTSLQVAKSSTCLFARSNNYQSTLEAIKDNPHLFPATSQNLNRLSTNQRSALSIDDDLLTSPLSPKEFLTTLSAEMIRVSRSDELDDFFTLDKRNTDQTSYERESRKQKDKQPRWLAIPTVAGTGVAAFTLATEHALPSHFSYESTVSQQHYDHSPYELFGYREQDVMTPLAQLTSASNGQYDNYQEYWRMGTGESNALRDLALSLPPPTNDFTPAVPYYESFYSPYHDRDKVYLETSHSIYDRGDNVAMESWTSMSTQHSSTDPSTINSLTQSDASSDTLHLNGVQKFTSAESLEIPSSGSSSTDSLSDRFQEVFSHSGASVNEAFLSTKEASIANIDHMIRSISHSLKEIPLKVTDIGTSSAKFTGNALNELSKLKASSLPHFPQFDSEPVHIPLNANVLIKSIGDASISDIIGAVTAGIISISGVLFKFIDFILSAVSGTSLSRVLSNVQTSVQSLIETASNAVVHTLNSLGDMTLKDLLQSLVTIIIVVSDILLKITNAIIYLISGKDAYEWALQASTTIDTSMTNLVASVSSAYDDVTHKTMSEVAMSIGDFSQAVGNDLMAVMSTVNHYGVMDGILSGSDISNLADSFDNIATVIQTTFSW